MWMHLVNGTGNSPSPGRPTPGVVKQDKSSTDPQRVRMCKGEGPIGPAKGKQTNTVASCQPPPLPLLPASAGGLCPWSGGVHHHGPCQAALGVLGGAQHPPAGVADGHAGVDADRRPKPRGPHPRCRALEHPPVRSGRALQPPFPPHAQLPPHPPPRPSFRSASLSGSILRLLPPSRTGPSTSGGGGGGGGLSQRSPTRAGPGEGQGRAQQTRRRGTAR